MSVIRWANGLQGSGIVTKSVMRISPRSGEWVRFGDYEKLRQERDEARAEVGRLTAQRDKLRDAGMYVLMGLDRHIDDEPYGHWLAPINRIRVLGDAVREATTPPTGSDAE